MMRSLPLATGLWLLLASAVAAQTAIDVPAQIAPYDPIFASVPKGADIYMWDCSTDTVTVVPVGDGSSVHIWAPPGTHKLRCLAISVKVDFEKKTKEVTQIAYRGTFTVGTAPPGPNPPGPQPPGPQPPPVPGSDRDYFQLWLSKIPKEHYSAAKITAVADSYESIAAMAAATSGWDLEKMKQALKAKLVNILGAEGVVAYNFATVAVWQSKQNIAESDLQGQIALFQKTAALIKEASKQQ